jgi:hypothetical protein
LEPLERLVRSAGRSRDLLTKCRLPVTESRWLRERCDLDGLSLANTYSTGGTRGIGGSSSPATAASTVAVGVAPWAAAWAVAVVVAVTIAFHLLELIRIL